MERTFLSLILSFSIIEIIQRNHRCVKSIHEQFDQMSFLIIDAGNQTNSSMFETIANWRKKKIQTRKSSSKNFYLDEIQDKRCFPVRDNQRFNLKFHWKSNGNSRWRFHEPFEKCIDRLAKWKADREFLPRPTLDQKCFDRCHSMWFDRWTSLKRRFNLFDTWHRQNEFKNYPEEFPTDRSRWQRLAGQQWRKTERPSSREKLGKWVAEEK